MTENANKLDLPGRSPHNGMMETIKKSDEEAQTAAGDEALPMTPERLFGMLGTCEITYKLYRHQPIFTVEEGEPLKAGIPGLHCRNLFLRDKKKAMFLVVAANETSIDLKKLQNLIGSDRLSFGSPERLWMYLGVRPGSVCPYAVINDREHQVAVILDKTMMEAEIINHHPLDNAMTITVTPAGLVRFFEYTGHEPRIIDLTAAAPDPT